MELDHATIRILAAIEREQEHRAEQEEWLGSSDSSRPSVLETESMQATLHCSL